MKPKIHLRPLARLCAVLFFSGLCGGLFVETANAQVCQHGVPWPKECPRCRAMYGGGSSGGGNYNSGPSQYQFQQQQEQARAAAEKKAQEEAEEQARQEAAAREAARKKALHDADVKRDFQMRKLEAMREMKGLETVSTDSGGNGGLKGLDEGLRDAPNDPGLKGLDDTPSNRGNNSGQIGVNLSGIRSQDARAKAELGAHNVAPVTPGKNISTLGALSALASGGATEGKQRTIDTAGGKGGPIDISKIATPNGTTSPENQISALNIDASLKKIYLENPQIQSDPDIQQKLQAREKEQLAIEQANLKLKALDLSKPDNQVTAASLKQAIAVETGAVQMIDLSVGDLIQRLARERQMKAQDKQPAANPTSGH